MNNLIIATKTLFIKCSAGNNICKTDELGRMSSGISLSFTCKTTFCFHLSRMVRVFTVPFFISTIFHLVQWDILTLLLKVPSYLMDQIDQFEILNFKSHLSGYFWLLTPKFLEVVGTYELSFCLKRNAVWVVWTIFHSNITRNITLKPS